MKKQNDDITLKGLVDIFLPKVLIILIVSMLCAAILGAYSMLLKPDMYTSRGKYMVSKVNYSNENAQTGLTTSEIAAMQGMIANAQEIINTTDFAKRVQSELPSKYATLSTSSIMSMMKVSLSSKETTCYYFSVTSRDPMLSQAVADVAGNLLVDVYKDTKYAIEIKLIETAEVPTSPNSKGAVKNSAIGFAVGLVVSLLAVFISSNFDVIIRSREKIEENFDIPILGVIPRLETNEVVNGPITLRINQKPESKSSGKG